MSQQDVEQLHQAVTKDDKNAIINVLAYRNNDQRVAIKLKYKELYQKELEDVIPHSGLVGRNFHQVICALLKTPAELAADELHQAVKGLGTDEDALIEILCTRQPIEIAKIKEIYKIKFKNELEKDIADDTSGDFRKLLLAICKGNQRYEPTGATPKDDAQKLYEAGEKHLGTDEEALIVILTTRSMPWVREIYEEYGKISKRTLCDALDSELSGDLRKGMLAIVQTACCPGSFFAERLQWSMKGLGTNDSTLIRIVVSRFEVDMLVIIEAYQKKTGRTLTEDIQDDTSGEYRDLLLALLRPSDTRK